MCWMQPRSSSANDQIGRAGLILAHYEEKMNFCPLTFLAVLSVALMAESAKLPLIVNTWPFTDATYKGEFDGD